MVSSIPPFDLELRVNALVVTHEDQASSDIVAEANEDGENEDDQLLLR